MGLQFEARLTTGQEPLDTDLCDLHLARTASGEAFLYAGTGRNGGLSVYELTPGADARLVDTVYFAGLSDGLAQTQIDILTTPDSRMLLIGTSNAGKLLSYELESDQGFGALSELAMPQPGADILAWSTAGGEGDLLYAISGTDGVICAYQMGGAGLQQIAAEVGATLSDSGAVLLSATPSDTGPTLVAVTGGTGGTGLTSYQQPGGAGTLAVVNQIGTGDGLGFSAATAVESFTAYGASWVLLAAAGSSTLSVLRVGGDGSLQATDHLLDTRETRFGGVQALAVVDVQGQTFVFAGGADDGLAVFTLLSDGRLVHLQSLADATGLGLQNITAIQAAQIDDEIQIFVASQATPGLSQFSWSLGELGALLESEAASSGILQGTARDDILVSGTGATVLTGGAGADVFVLRPSQTPLRVTDFTPGEDRLDLSHFMMLRAPAQLLETPLVDGLQLDFGSTQITIEQASGQPLSLMDLWQSGRFSTPDRLLFASAPPDPEILGTQGDDNLAGTAEKDVIRGGGGQDTLSGMAGNDSLHGDDGADHIWAGAGDDYVQGGAGHDTIGTSTGADLIDGGDENDLVWSGPGNDTVNGGAGHDEIWAISGDDLVLGGPGNDTLGGADGRDTIDGGGGGDILNGGAGADSLTGGPGDDDIWGGAGDDRTYGGTGRDQIGTWQGNDYVDGGDGDDTVWSGPGDDTVIGGVGNDEIWAIGDHDVVIGGGGWDTLGGGTGDDNIDGGAGDDLMYGGFGNDTLTGGTGRDAIWAMDGADRVWGGSGNDTLGGGEGRDRLFGEGGSDEIIGGTGDDQLDGGTGDDILSGKAGADIFIFATDHGADRITDFTPGQDHIRFDIAGLGFGDLTITAVSQAVRIASAEGGILLDGLAVDQISAADFLFL